MDKLLFKRILVAALTILALVYVTYLLISANFNMYPTENAVQATVSNSIRTNGLIIRNETVIQNQSTGILSYTVSNGEAVEANCEVAKVQSGGCGRQQPGGQHPKKDRFPERYAKKCQDGRRQRGGYQQQYPEQSYQLSF